MKIIETVKPKLTMQQIIQEALNEGIISRTDASAKLCLLPAEKNKARKRLVKA